MSYYLGIDLGGSSVKAVATTPDGTPVIGRTPHPGLFLNTGHGTLGWTMACGSAKSLADLMSGRSPEIDTEGLGIERYAA